MKKLVLSLAFAVAASFSWGQDIHFSQFNASPLTLNPALTGKLECTYRAAVNYRDQWNSIPAPYRTYSAAFDAALWKNKLNGSAFGIGLLAYNDVSGDGNLQNTSFGLSLAYHARLGEGNFLSAGFQGTFVQKNVDIFALVFGNQIGPNGVMLVPSGEIFNGPISYPDLQAGIHWSSVFDNFSFNLGGAYYHILEPEERFLQSTPSLQSTLAPRYVGHGGFTVALGDNASLSPSGLFMMQAGVYQINAGTSLGFHGEEAAFYVGVWDRMVQGFSSSLGNDAVIALVGVEFSNLLFGFSYDISTSGISDANNGRGGFELSLSYNGCIEAKRRVTMCPKF